MAPAQHQRYFRRWPVGEDPAELLEPSNQHSTPWGEPERGPCDKCDGAGYTQYRCRSCLERGTARLCPACAGRVEYRDVCPACEGTGEVSRVRREGVSVFPSIEGLYRYVTERADGDGCAIVELQGELTGDRDLDADAGALLIRPTAVLALHPLDDQRSRR